ncbi:MAG: valine--tRNA ligase [Chloroflexi bacterium]|nr:valine--tRNA ligase [Chloroflexota bacterium]MYK35256.1 valine--tRNA ligase [Chloroflexota bacterium]
MTANPAEEPLSKAYDPRQVEGRLYEWWERSGYFRATPDPDREPFTIIMPPPNVTGELHLGHAMTAAIEDALTRYHRMKGDVALYLPGTDHAGIATQVVVERQLAAEELTRHDIGREAFLKRIWEWVDKTGDTIDNQHRRLGASCDWERKTFTLDEGPARAVRTTFKNLYDDGLIYRGERMINWCVSCRTALSDLEVEHEEVQGKLYYIRYLYEDGSGHLTVATTRPETLLGDTAVAVNPMDERYTGAQGKRVRLPVLGRLIPVIADDAVATEFGTGALKITPGHDPNDFETGERHGLPIVNVLNADGTLNEEAGPYAGFDRFDARKAIVAQLEREGLLEKVEPHTHSVGHCQRSGDPVEPIVSMQWFVKIGPLAEPALAAVQDGRIRIVPERFARVYANWMENIRDWCISRQLWWGHRIPVWYCGACGHQTVAVDEPEVCEACGSGDIAQDEDVLDTWFSSGLWTHSTLGWPERNADLDYFYPTSVMETGYDILFFWVARMIMMGMWNMGDVPFRTVYLHGLVRDEHGQKMSKTRGNVRDPLDAIDQYGTDALRFALTTGTTPGNDSRFSDDRLEAARNFANKLWNVGRFVIGQTEGQEGMEGWYATPPREHRQDRWMLSKAQQTAVRVNDLIAEFQIGEAERVLHEFIWSDFADWYIELAKVRMRNGDDQPRRVLAHVLERVLRLLHPFMPFVTEEIWQRLVAVLPPEGNLPESIMIAPYPDPKARLSEEELQARRDADTPASDEVDLLIDLVRAIRNVRAELKIEPQTLLDATVATSRAAAALETETDAIRSLARVGALRFSDADARLDTVRLVVRDVTVALNVGGSVDLETERERLRGEAAGVEKHVSGLEGRLNNAQFLDKAPAEVVERERERLESGRARLERITELLRDLGG